MPFRKITPKEAYCYYRYKLFYSKERATHLKKMGAATGCPQIYSHEQYQCYKYGFLALTAFRKFMCKETEEKLTRYVVYKILSIRR